MLRLRWLIILSSALLVGCPTSSMLRQPNDTLLPPPKRSEFVSRVDFAEAISQYQTYLEAYRSSLVNEVKVDQINAVCIGTVIAKPFVLPTAPEITSTQVEDQLNEVLNYVDTIRQAAITHNGLLSAQLDLYKRLCPGVNNYVMP